MARQTLAGWSDGSFSHFYCTETAPQSNIQSLAPLFLSPAAAHPPTDRLDLWLIALGPHSRLHHRLDWLEVPESALAMIVEQKHFATQLLEGVGIISTVLVCLPFLLAILILPLSLLLRPAWEERKERKRKREVLAAVFIGATERARGPRASAAFSFPSHASFLPSFLPAANRLGNSLSDLSIDPTGRPTKRMPTRRGLHVCLQGADGGGEEGFFQVVR